MEKYIFLLALIPLIASGTSQRLYSNDVIAKNICGTRLNVLTENDTNNDFATRNFDVAVGERFYVATYFSYGELVHEQISKDYKLTISAGNSEVTIDQAQLLKLLKDAKYIDEGKSDREWVIESYEICPVDGNSSGIEGIQK